MLKVESQSLQSPGIGARIMKYVSNANSLPPYVVIENKGALGASISFQESMDQVTWTTVVGTYANIDPGLSHGAVINSTARYVALFAQGTTLLDVHLVRQLSGVVEIL